MNQPMNKEEPMQENPKKRVLVVDDMSNWRELLRDILSPEFAVVVRANYKDALEAIRTTIPPFHAAVLDIRLVDGDAENREGLELAELLKAGEESTKTIVLTGYPTRGATGDTLRELSVFAYLEKVPCDGDGVFDPETFIHTVRRAAREAETLQARRAAREKPHALLMVTDPTVEEHLAGILRGLDFDVHTAAGTGDIKKIPAAKRYRLIVLHADVLKHTPDITDTLGRYVPDAKIVVLKNDGVDPIARGLQGGEIHQVITIDGSDASYNTFGAGVRTLTAPGVNKYLCARFQHEPLIAGRQNHLYLSLEDQRTEHTVALLSLSPYSIKQGKTSLQLSFSSPGMDIPTTGVHWPIPDVRSDAASLPILLTPKASGDRTITVYIRHGESRWGIDIKNNTPGSGGVKDGGRLFLSYISSDEIEIRKLYARLRDEGFDPWMDKEDILPGENWEYMIEKAMRNARFILVCLNSDSIDYRGFFNREISLALELEKEKQEHDIYLIPVRLEKCEVPHRLRKKQWLDLFEPDGWEFLLKALHKGIERYSKKN